MSQGSHPSTSTSTPKPPSTVQRLTISNYDPIKSRSILNSPFLSVLTKHALSMSNTSTSGSGGGGSVPKQLAKSASLSPAASFIQRKFPRPSATVTSSSANSLVRNNVQRFAVPRKPPPPLPPIQTFNKAREQTPSTSSALQLYKSQLQQNSSQVKKLQFHASAVASATAIVPTKKIVVPAKRIVPATATAILNDSLRRKRKLGCLYPKLDLAHRPQKRKKVLGYVPEKEEVVSDKDSKLISDYLARNPRSQEREQLEHLLKKYISSSTGGSFQGAEKAVPSAAGGDKSKGQSGSGKNKGDTTFELAKYQPIVKRKTNSRKRITVVKIPENPLVSHTIELLRHKRDLQKRLELIDEEGIVHRLEEQPKLKQPIPKGHFTIPNIPLTGGQAKEVLQNRLPILLAHGGYTHSDQQPMEVLGDVLEGFYKKIASRMKQVTEMQMAGGEQEFGDPVERTLVEMNLGGVRGVQRFYQTRVIDQRARVDEQCKYLRKLYAHRIRLKVGMVVSSSGGNNSSSSNSTSSSSQVVSPGNSVLTEILSGLDATGSSYLFEQEEKIKQLQQMRPPQPPPPQPPQPTVSGENQASCHYPPLKLNSPSPHPSPILSSSSNRPQNQNHLASQASHQKSPIVPSRNASSQQQHPSLVTAVHNKSVPVSLPQAQQGNDAQQGKTASSSSLSKITYRQPSSTLVNNSPTPMVSINLNNNVDLGGFVPITSPGASRTPTLNVNKGIITGVGGDSKAKLKEALNQKNLLRLNFEQVPSSCDSTVLLSSSSPSLSSGSNSTTKKSSTPSSSLSQTARLKL